MAKKTLNVFFTVLLFCLCFLFSKGAMAEEQARIDWVNENIPLRFENKAMALKRKCAFVQLKSKSSITCVLTNDGDAFAQARLIGIYEMDSTGQFNRMDLFEITSWHGESKVKFSDLLGTGNKFILVSFEGNTGTGLPPN